MDGWMDRGWMDRWMNIRLLGVRQTDRHQAKHVEHPIGSYRWADGFDDPRLSIFVTAFVNFNIPIYVPRDRVIFLTSHSLHDGLKFRFGKAPRERPHTHTG